MIDRPLDSAKRLMDISLSVFAILFLSPVLIAAAILIAFNMGFPILFSQIRPGFKGKPFKLYKFRTMKDIRDRKGRPLPDEERLTKLGSFLRSTSIDELPELFNVIIGDMSLVGPRPLLMEYLPLYTKRQTRRHDVKPGITGWAQVNGRNAITWEKKFDLDLWYIDHWSFYLDLKILVMTVISALKRENINAKDHATMPPFMGVKKISGPNN